MASPNSSKSKVQRSKRAWIRGAPTQVLREVMCEGRSSKSREASEVDSALATDMCNDKGIVGFVAVVGERW